MAQILKNVRVLDLSQVMAGPFGTMILGDMGAEIIKVENPEGGDLSRASKQYMHKGESAYYMSFNRNKKSIVLNLRSEKALEIFYNLVKISDVVYDNYRAGVLKKLKIDYDTLKKINPKIICCSVTGFGSNSPYKERPAFDLNIQAMGGVMSFTGEEPGRPPVRLGYPMGDLGGGLFAAMSVLSALFYREVTGKGQQCDVGMLDVQIALMTYRAQYYFLENVLPHAIGSSHTSNVPIRAFKAKDGKYLTLEAHHPKFFESLCNVIEMPDLAKDERFNSRASRLKNRESLMKILEEKFAEKDRDEWVPLLINAGVPSGPVNNLAEALSDESVLSRNMVVNVNHLGENIKMVGNPIKMSEMGEDIFLGAPTLGQDTEEILSKYLSFTSDQVETLRKENVIK